MNAPISLQQLTAYYEQKTQAILDRYGPGPRVHYHTGLMTEPPPQHASRLELRRALVLAQEQLMYHAAETWRARSTLCGDVLDVGCGLGGGSIFWAQEYGARVTAITIAPAHLPWISHFAAWAGVAARVRPLVCDAASAPGRHRFDAAVAVDSSSSFARAPWFQRLAVLLRPGGRVFIADCFLADSDYAEPFNRHWRACIGAIAEYCDAARAAGLRLEQVEDLSSHAAHFWSVSIAFLQTEAEEKGACLADEASLQESLRVHTLVRQGLTDGGLRYALLSFSRP